MRATCLGSVLVLAGIGEAFVSSVNRGTNFRHALTTKPCMYKYGTGRAGKGLLNPDSASPVFTAGFTSSTANPKDLTTTLFSMPPKDWMEQRLDTSLSGVLPKDTMDRLRSPDSYTCQSPLSQLSTLARIVIPSFLASLVAFILFPPLAIFLASSLNNAGVFAVLSQDSSQFVQNFLTVTGLLFSILVGQTYYFMYQQQESVYYALFAEVTEAKSLLEQTALVCGGRPMYGKILSDIKRYIDEDLKALSTAPSALLSRRPVDDPLEGIMYSTSVGTPSAVYETVRSLRQARASRLGALQRKLPFIHVVLLWFLAAIELVSFPLLGAGTQTIGGYNILTVEGSLFGIMTFGIVLTLRVVGELYRPAGGAYNVDGVLSIMVKGLEEELEMRQKQVRDGEMPPSNPDSPAAASSVAASSVIEMEREIFGSKTATGEIAVQKAGGDLGRLRSYLGRVLRRGSKKSQ